MSSGENSDRAASLVPFCLQMWRSNKKRDAQYGPADPVKAADNGMAGMTEDENKDFRYCY